MLGVFLLITVVIHFTGANTWIYLCQKCCRRWNEKFCELLLEENLSSTKEKSLSLGKVESYFVEFLTLVLALETHSQRCVAGTEVLPEHHKPLKGHHFLIKRIWYCLCSKPAGAQGVPRVTRAGSIHAGMDPHLHTVEGAGA